MSAPTTAETPTMRERLAQVACRAYFDDVPGWSHEYDNDPGAWEAVRDAVLREMLEPSEGMVWKAREFLSPEDSETDIRLALRAVVQSILTETQD